MRAIPRQEILQSVDTGNGDMKRILDRLRWQRLSGHEGCRELNSGIRDIQKGEAFEHGEASLGRFGVACACLGQYDLGGKELVACLLLVPPRYSELLMGGHEQITAWPCREITDDARFDIDGRFCATCVWGLHDPQLCKNPQFIWIMIPDFCPGIWTIL